MTQALIRRITAAIADTAPFPVSSNPRVRQAFEDTLAVIFAGWEEPVTRKAAGIAPGGEALRPMRALADNPEHTAFVHGVAAHALDYDDVHMGSTTHPSVPIVGALLAAAHGLPNAGPRMAAAYAVGLAVNLALGRVLGFPHYEKGWHATSTIGPLAGAAATAYLMGLDGTQAAHALAIAAAQAGGLQRNFGTMAKPVQAGLAAAAGYRSAALARAGVTADPDVFGPKGYFDLYGGERLAQQADDTELDISASGVCVKLYPCCYMSHRPAGAALQARKALQHQGKSAAGLASVDIVGIPGVFTALRVKNARTGAEGKFDGPYVVACALLDGAVTLAHFADEAVRAPERAALAARIALVERGGGAASGAGGAIELIGRGRDGAEIVRVSQPHFPGSPESPPTPREIEAKVRDCLAYYHQGGGKAVRYERFEEEIDGLFRAAKPARAKPAKQRAAGD
jgi:2-methylcitrate dehydratase PrpD